MVGGARRFDGVGRRALLMSRGFFLSSVRGEVRRRDEESLAVGLNLSPGPRPPILLLSATHVVPAGLGARGALLVPLRAPFTVIEAL